MCDVCLVSEGFCLQIRFSYVENAVCANDDVGRQQSVLDQKTEHVGLTLISSHVTLQY